LVHGSGYRRIVTVGCSDRTIQSRLKVWVTAGARGTAETLATARGAGVTSTVAQLDDMEVPGPAGRDLARKLSWVAGAGEPGR